MPSKNAAPSTASAAKELVDAASSQYSGNASRVPTVPGAAGASPAPAPRATTCAGCRHMKRHDGARGASGEMIVAPTHYPQRGAVGRAHDELGRITAMRAHAAYAGHTHARVAARPRDAFARGARRGKAQFIVVAAGKQRTAGGDTIEVPTEHRGGGQCRKFNFRRHAGRFEHMAEVREQAVRDIDRAMRDIP